MPPTCHELNCTYEEYTTVDNSGVDFYICIYSCKNWPNDQKYHKVKGKGHDPNLQRDIRSHFCIGWRAIETVGSVCIPSSLLNTLQVFSPIGEELFENRRTFKIYNVAALTEFWNFTDSEGRAIPPPELNFDSKRSHIWKYLQRDMCSHFCIGCFRPLGQPIFHFMITLGEWWRPVGMV